MSKDKHFTCTGCSRESTHTTTRLRRDKTELIGKGEALCDKCVEDRLGLVAEMKELSISEARELLG